MSDINRTRSDFNKEKVEWRSRIHREWLVIQAYKTEEINSGLNDGTKDSIWNYSVAREDFDGKYDVPKKYRKKFQIIHSASIVVQYNEPIDLESIIEDFLNDMTRKCLLFLLYAEKHID